MRINNISNQIFTYNKSEIKKRTEANNTIMPEQKELSQIPVISFKAMHNIKKKNVDTELETKKLLKQLDEIIASDMSPEELMQMYERKVMSQLLQKKQKADELLAEAERLLNDPIVTQMKAERLLIIKKEFKQLEKNVFKINPLDIPKKPEVTEDTALINKFRTAILEDNFNLDRIYKDYYSELDNIRTLEELNKKYPRIKIPDKPEYVIADRITDNLTRDFFEKLDDLMRQGDADKIYSYIESNVYEVLKQSTKYHDEVFKKVFEAAATDILMKYDRLLKEDKFANVPLYRKTSAVQITENDLKLLSVDFDDFVLTVLRKQYLENQKPNTIKYTDGDITIPVSSLRENAYKFEKTSEKTKQLILTAKKIQAAKRDYENFDEDKLRSRLSLFASSEIGNNELIFDRIAAFDSCNFGQADKNSLIEFLKVLDTVKDGDMTVNEAEMIIKDRDLRPKETEKLNAIEKQKVIESLKMQQQKALELNALKAGFDNAMNNLYINGLSGIAAICYKYRPENLDEETVENAEFIIREIEQNIRDNKTKLSNTIKNRDTYNYYKTNQSQSDVFLKAREYAKKSDGSIDINKAGIYLKNAETVINAPDSLEYHPEKDFAKEIIDRAGEDAALYLSKYDEYKEFEDKTHILKYIDKFNLKDSIDKFVLKHIVENDYVNTDTVSTVKLNENNSVNATITANAKRQILEKYMFPGCLEFLEGFEDALSSFATEFGSSGIKKTGSNNKALEYKQELKLIGHDDRLFSVDNNYCFDIFSDRGLH